MSKIENSAKSAKKYLFFVFLFGFVLRLWGVSFGLPYLYHADEPIVVNHALAFGSGDFNPHFFKIPPLVSYLLFGCYGFYFLILKVFGFIANADQFFDLFLRDPSSYYLLARIIFGTMLGSFAILELHYLVKKHFSQESALISALLLATAFIHVRDSHYIYLDIPLICVLIPAFSVVLGIIKEATWSRYVLFGALCGLAISVKYNGFFIMVPFLFVHLSQYKSLGFKKWFINLLSAGVSCVFIFILTNPFSIIDKPTFLKEIVQQGHAESFTGLTHHFMYSLLGGIGPILLIISIFALIWALFRKDRRYGSLAIFMVTYYIVLVFKGQPYDRYVLPIIPFVFILASEFLIYFKNRFRINKIVLTAILAAMVLPSLYKIILMDKIFSEKDIRTVALEWTQKEIPADERIALDSPFFLPKLKPSLEQLSLKLIKAQKTGSDIQIRRLKKLMENGIGDPRYNLYFLSTNKDPDFLMNEPKVGYDMDELKRLNIRYVFFVQNGDDSKKQFLEMLKSKAKLVARFTPYKNSKISQPIDQLPLTGGSFLFKDLYERQRNGQIIEVYKLQD